MRMMGPNPQWWPKRAWVPGPLIISVLRAVLESTGTAYAWSRWCVLQAPAGSLHTLPLAGGLAPWILKWQHCKACSASLKLDELSSKSVLGWWSSVKWLCHGPGSRARFYFWLGDACETCPTWVLKNSAFLFTMHYFSSANFYARKVH